MNGLVPELLSVLAALLTGGFATALALAAFELCRRIYQRCLSQPGASPCLAAAREGRSNALQLLRRTVVAYLSAMNERWVPEPRLAQLEGALLKAGKPLDLRAAEIVAFMELSALVFFVLGGAFSLWLHLGITAWIFFALLGAGYPLIWLRDKVKARHHAIIRALPYNLDLLTLSVEAGLDFAAALGKVVEKGRKGPLTDELAITLKELKLGKTREEALRALGRRVDLQGLSSFVHALVQADRLGTSLGKVLRVLSTQMRVDRTQRAEKLANEAPVKLLIPLIGFIFPTIFIMLFGPIAYQVFFGGSF
jgi:tight adherence protein C